MLDKGIYSSSEAALLIHGNSRNVDRWIRWKPDSGIVQPDYQTSDQHVLSFLALIEVMAINELRNLGLSLQYIRKAHDKACELFQMDHPFALNSIYTDKRGLWIDIFDEDKDDPNLLQIITSQIEITPITKPFLTKFDLTVEFNKEGLSVRWWPLSRDRQIVVDPCRAFGQPIIYKEGVPTYTIAASVSAEKGNIEKVAWWYEIDTNAVNDAWKFETEYTKRLAA
jgi:uncharacterized protein (DUF433 family)